LGPPLSISNVTNSAGSHQETPPDISPVAAQRPLIELTPPLSAMYSLKVGQVWKWIRLDLKLAAAS
jgi:hypothetical protein